jgi:DNA-directed RNA polymerase beta subunit
LGVCLSRLRGDATPFTDVTVEDIGTARHGLPKHGNEAMYQGHTVGPECACFHWTYIYQRLKHLVDDKVSRARGLLLCLRYPLEGRSRDGHAWEMGAVFDYAWMRQLFRFFVSSDRYRIHICERCGA